VLGRVVEDVSMVFSKVLTVHGAPQSMTKVLSSVMNRKCTA
jgi:hypothetical protein